VNDRLPFGAELIVFSEDRAVVTLEGEVDIYTSPEFREVLIGGIDGGARRVLLDLAAVTFMDSTAISVLVDGVNRLRASDGTLDVVCGRGSVRRILEIAGLASVLGIYATRDEALADFGLEESSGAVES
jgi:anti-sigma B factor antagonist